MSNNHSKKVEWVRTDTEKLVYLNRVLDAFYKVLESNIKNLLSGNKTGQHIRLPIHLIRQSFVDKNLIFVKAPDNSLFEVSNPENCNFNSNCYEPVLDFVANDINYYKSLYQIYDLTKPSQKFKMNKPDFDLIPKKLFITETDHSIKTNDTDILTGKDKNRLNQDHAKLVGPDSNDTINMNKNNFGKRLFDESFSLNEQAINIKYPVKRVLKFKENTLNDLNDNNFNSDRFYVGESHNLKNSLINKKRNLSPIDDEISHKFDSIFDHNQNNAISLNTNPDINHFNLNDVKNFKENSKTNFSVFKTTSFNKINQEDNIKLSKTESFNHSTTLGLKSNNNTDIIEQLNLDLQTKNQIDSNLLVELQSDLTNLNNTDTNFNDSKVSINNDNALLDTTFFTTNSSTSFLFNENSCENVTAGLDSYRQSDQKFYTPDTSRIKMASTGRYFTPNFKQCYLDEIKDCDVNKVSKLNFNAEHPKKQPLSITTFDLLSRMNENDFYFETLPVSSSKTSIYNKCIASTIDNNNNFDDNQLIKNNNIGKHLESTNDRDVLFNSLNAHKNPTIFYYGSNDNFYSKKNLNKTLDRNHSRGIECDENNNNDDIYDDDEYDDDNYAENVDDYDDYNDNNYDGARSMLPASRTRHSNRNISIKEEVDLENDVNFNSNPITGSAIDYRNLNRDIPYSDRLAVKFDPTQKLNNQQEYNYYRPVVTNSSFYSVKNEASPAIYENINKMATTGTKKMYRNIDVILQDDNTCINDSIHIKRNNKISKQFHLDLSSGSKLLYNHSIRQQNITNFDDHIDHLSFKSPSYCDRVQTATTATQNYNKAVATKDNENLSIIEYPTNKKSEQFFLNINSQSGQEIKVLVLHEKSCKISVNNNRFYFRYKVNKARQAFSSVHQLLNRSKTFDKYISSVATLLNQTKGDTSFKYTIVDSVNAKNIEKNTRPRLLTNVDAAIDNYFVLTANDNKS